MVGGLWRTHVSRPRFGPWSDIVLACCLIILCLPLMTLVALAIKCDSRGPALVWDRRTAPGGRQFWALGFRCTVPEVGARSDDETQLTFVGGIIRYLRIDCLPQLVNVLLGDMTCFPGQPDSPFFLE